MCGIVGYCSSGYEYKELLERLSNQIENRGPDDNGYWYADGVGFAHRRLSIIDTSLAGHQPMSTGDDRYKIVYNGEIYNFKSLREELKTYGFVFTSDSDTEVILYGYVLWGTKVCSKLDGMFAFAVYDKYEKTLFLARDRSGIKPLYYFQDSEKLLFCSQAKPLAKELSLAKNDNAVAVVLATGSIAEPYTYWRELYSLEKGHYAIYKNSKLTIVKYSSYGVTPKYEMDFRTAANEVRRLLVKAVEGQLVSDATLGVFLSGGVDSSVLVAIAKKLKPDIQTISLVFDEKEYDESFFQKSVADALGAKRHVYKVTKTDFHNSLDDFFIAMDQPTIDGLNVFLVSEAAKQAGVKTVLSGLGSDEIFAGYPSFKDPIKMRLASLIPSYFFTHADSKYQKMEYLRLGFPYGAWLARRGLFSPQEIDEIFGIKKQHLFDLLSQLAAKQELGGDSVDMAGLCELNNYMLNQLLRDADVFGMYKSLEIRVPFLSNELVDFVLRLPSNLKLNTTTNKPLLVDAIRTELPSAVWERPKQGFVLPFKDWLSLEFKKDPRLSGKHWSKQWALNVLERFDG